MDRPVRRKTRTQSRAKPVDENGVSHHRITPCLALVLALGCEGVDGSTAAARGAVTYAAADDGFRITYATPPWEVSEETGTAIELTIGAALFGYVLPRSPPTHIFRMEYADAPDGVDALIDAADIDLDGVSLETGGELPEEGEIPDGEIPDEVEDELPSYLQGIDLANPGDVAFAELTYLLDEEDAQLEQPMRPFTTRTGVEGLVFQVILDPGVYVRTFYFDGPERSIRAAFASAFDLETSDIEWMVASIDVRAPEMEAP